jgi:hypothetical protein
MARDAFDLLNPFHMYGMSPVAARSDGAGLPRSTAMSNDNVAKPYHPDSGVFWLGALLVATFAGITGASVRLHAGPARAGAKIGKD